MTNMEYGRMGGMNKKNNFKLRIIMLSSFRHQAAQGYSPPICQLSLIHLS